MTDDKSTILSFLGWEKCDCGSEVCRIWTPPQGLAVLFPNIPLDSNLIHEAEMKLSEEQKAKYLKLLWDEFLKTRPNCGLGILNTRFLQWLLFDANQLKTCAKVLAEVLRGGKDL